MLTFVFFQYTRQIRTKGFKSIQYLEKDLHTLYQIQVKYLERTLKNTPAKANNNNSNNTATSEYQLKYIDKLINKTPIGVFKKSELGQPLRLYYYLSPLDLIQHHAKDLLGERISLTPAYKLLGSLTVEQLVQHELGAYVTISLQSTRHTAIKSEPLSETAMQVDEQQTKHTLPDSSWLILGENDDEKSWHGHLNPYFNVNFNNFERYF